MKIPPEPNTPSAAATAPKPAIRQAGGWSPSHWDQLLQRIRKKKVVPIIGKDLLVMDPATSGGAESLHRYLASRLVERLAESLKAEGREANFNGPLSYSLNDAFYLCSSMGLTAGEVRYSLLEILKEAPAQVISRPLQQLAEIRDFELLITTTFDKRLEQAIALAGTGASRREPKAFAFEKLSEDDETITDVPAAREYTSEEPAIYYLMGRLENTESEIVLTEEDLLERVCTLFSENRARAPHNLLNELSGKDLLLLGCRFSDWLGRFFLRAARRQRISSQATGGCGGGLMEYVIDEDTPDNKDLVVFMQRFPTRFRIYRSPGAVAFVDELRTAWAAKFPDRIAPFAAEAQNEPDPAATMPIEAPPGALFISYSREDDRAVKRLHRSLGGYNIWYDQKKLQFAEDWEQTIRTNIATCRYFMPIISRSTERRQEGFFWKEWNLAVERSKGMQPGVPFILPVVIEDVDAGTARVPTEFHKANWYRLMKGQVTEDFLKELRRLFGGSGGSGH